MATAATKTKTANGSALIDPDLKSDVHEQVDTLRADIAELTKAVSLLTQDSSNRIQAKAADAAADGRKKIDDATEEARLRAAVAGDDAYVAGQKVASELQANVAQNPFAALAIAAGIGFFAGAFAKR